MTLNKLSSPEEKRSSSEAVFEQLSDYFFDRVNLLNNPGTAVSSAAGSPNTSTTDYVVGLRVPDTAYGKYMRPDKRSRLRTMFYINEGQASSDCYLLSPAVYSSQTLPSPLISMASIDSYVGIRIFEGLVSLISKDSLGEKIIPTTLTITDDTTYVLDVIYNISHAEVLINGESMGTISCNLLETINSLETFYPIFGPVRSSTGTGVRMTIEGYQFLQDR